MNTANRIRTTQSIFCEISYIEAVFVVVNNCPQHNEAQMLALVFEKPNNTGRK